MENSIRLDGELEWGHTCWEGPSGSWAADFVRKPHVAGEVGFEIPKCLASMLREREGLAEDVEIFDTCLADE